MRQLFSSVTKKCTKTAKIVTKIVILREIDKNSDENTPKPSHFRTLDIRLQIHCGNRQNTHSFAIPLTIKALDKIPFLWNTLTIKLFSLRDYYVRTAG